MPKSIYRHFRQRRFRNMIDEASEPIPDYVPEDTMEVGDGLIPPSNGGEKQEDSNIMEDNSTSDIFKDAENIESKKQLDEVPDDVLQFIDTSCQSKSSQHNSHSTTFTCSSCGANLNRKKTCCGPALQSIENGRWHPINKNNFFNMEKGVSLSREECNSAIEKLTENTKEVDFVPFLEMAEKFHGKHPDLEDLAFGFVWNTVMHNKLLAKSRNDDELRELTEMKIVEGRRFSLERARIDEPVISLPSRRTFKMSSLMTVVQASKFMSSEFEEHSKAIFRLTFKKLASMDPYFSVYTVSDYSSQGYAPLGDEFLEKVSVFIAKGFQQQLSTDIMTRCTCAAKRVLLNLLDRIRKELRQHQLNLTEVLDRFKELMKTDKKHIDRSLLDPNKQPMQRLHCLLNN